MIKRHLIKIATIISIIISLNAVINCAKTDNTPAENSEASIPESELYNSTIVFTIKGIRNTIIKTSYIAKYSDKKEAFGRDIRADFFDENGVHTSDMVADSGWFDENNKKMEVMGHVVVVNDDGTKLETESLRWDPNINKIVTDDFVKITRGEDILTGYGLTTDQKMSNIEILKDVKGVVKDIPENDEF